MKPNLSAFKFLFCAKHHRQESFSKSQITKVFHLGFSSKSFYHFSSLRLLIHFKLIFVYDVRESLASAVLDSVVKETILSPINSLGILVDGK